MESLKIIIVEDYSSDAELILRELKKSDLKFKATVVKKKADYCNLLDATIDLIICDHNLPEFNSLDALSILKDKGLNIPFIIVSGSISEEKAVECMKHGASDYLLKDRLARLAQAVIHALEQKRLQNENQRVFKNSSFLAQASSVLAASLDMNLITKNLVNLVVSQVFDLCSIWKLENNDEIGLMAYAFQSEDELTDSDLNSQNFHREDENFFHLEVPLFLKESSSFNKYPLTQKFYEKGIRGLITFPLIVEKQKIGTIIFGKKEADIDDIDYQLSLDISRYVAMAISNASLYAKTKQAHDEAQKAHRLKDEFLATVSHELRTPLGAIIGYSDMILRHKLSGIKLDHAVEAINRNAKTQLRLVSDLLDISGIVTGHFNVKKTSVMLEKVITNAIDTLQVAINAKSIQVSINSGKNVRPILGDAERLQQVVWNLLSNAIKFTPKEGKIEIELNDKISNIELTVRDSGKGIDPKFLPYIFDRFRQEDASLTRKYGGLGLGLSIVRYIVELHGGRVIAKSEGVNKGATFVVDFPVLAIDLPVEEWNIYENEKIIETSIKAEKISEGPGAVNDHSKGGTLNQTKIVIIDDSVEVLELVKILLENAGATVQSYESALKALKGIKENVPDLILCDISMPEMDGYSFIGALRAEEDYHIQSIPAAAFTAFVGTEYKKRAINAGFDYYIEKPVKIGELLDLVQKLKDKSSHAYPLH